MLDFDTAGDFQTGNVATGNSNQRKNVTGWTNTGGDTYSTGAAIGFGTSGQINGTNLPSANADGDATGGALCLNAAWQSQAWYSQEVTLPAGNYNLKFQVNNVGQNAQFDKNPPMFTFTTTSGSSFSGNVHSYPVNTWTEQTIIFALASETTGTIKIGYKAGNTGSGNTPKLVVDYVKALYLSNYTETLKSTIDRAKILNDRANGTLADAINTAQDVLDGADNTITYQATIDNAVTTLRDAISTAAAQIVLLEGENITFMLENADFESSTPVSVGITTYDYDAATNGTSFSRMQIVEGWTIEENGNAKSGGVFEFGQNPFLGSTGQTYQAPTTGSDTDETKALGLVAVWSSTIQYKQAVTFPAGSYVVEIPVYNTAGTTAFSKNLIGFVEDGGTEHLATSNKYSTGSWITESIVFELEEEKSGYLSLGYAASNKGSAEMPHLFIDYVKVTYTSPIAAAKYRYDEALGAAQIAIENDDYVNVTGSERTNLQEEINKEEPTTKDGYNSAADALIEKTSAFTLAKNKYDAFVTVQATEDPNLEYASNEKKGAFNTACSATPTSGDEAMEMTRDIINALRAYYESHALAEGVEGAENMTTYITNPAATDGNNGWTWTGVKNEPRNGESWTDSQGSNHYYFDGGNWNGSAWTTTMAQTISLPAGRYLLTAKGRAASNTTLTMAVGNESETWTSIGSTGGVFDRGWNDESVEFEIPYDKDIEIKVTATAEPTHEWFSISDFRLVQLEEYTVDMATPEQYDELASVIEEAEALTLGFQKDEYAPYNNIDLLNKLAAAKAIDTSVENQAPYVEEVTVALSLAVYDDAVKNDEEVNAVYNGMFATVQEGENYPKGWKRTNDWGEMKSGDWGTAYYNQPGSLQYGNNGVYTMPLKENTYYQLSFKYRSHENNSNKGVTVSVLNGKDGLNSKVFPANGSTSVWKDGVAIFKTGAAGNYVLTLANDGNTWMTAVEIYTYKGTVIDENVGYTAGTPEVYLKRTIKEGMNTVVLPFALTAEDIVTLGGEGAKAYTVSEYNATTDNLKFAEAEEVAANTPFFLNAVTAGTEFTFEDKTIVAGEPIVNVGEDCSLVGTYEKITVGSSTSTEARYILSGGKFYNVDSEVSLKSTRFYIQISSDEAATNSLSFSIEDGEANAINGIASETAAPEGIYNLQGQKVEKATKGIYIINGKKTLVK